jgi:dynein heavy chain 2
MPPQASLKESIALQESIEREGNVYLPVATFASDLYFTISDMTKLNNLYRISLSAFIHLFQKSLERAPHAGTSSDKRINALKQTLQDLVNYYGAATTGQKSLPQMTFGKMSSST